MVVFYHILSVSTGTHNKESAGGGRWQHPFVWQAGYVKIRYQLDLRQLISTVQFRCKYLVEIQKAINEKDSKNQGFR